MDLFSGDMLGHFTAIGGLDGIDRLGHLLGGLDRMNVMDTLGHAAQGAAKGVMHALESGFDVQSAPPVPKSAPTVPVDSEALGNAAGAAGAALGNAAASGAGAMTGTMGGGAKPLSIFSLFMQADIVVKIVMIALVLASVWCWAIIIEKMIRLRGLNRKANTFEERFWSGNSLEDLYDRMNGRARDPMGAIFIAAMREWRLGHRGGPSGPRPQLSERIERVMGLTLTRELETIENRLGFLASTGSVAPFVGLFGTVWGIMNSFHAIGMTNDTSLATVAPGIAEALFATALGLVAAIPAVIAYNKLSGDLDRYGSRLEGFSGEFGAILSRQLDEGGE